jgi:hypothetical protein
MINIIDSDTIGASAVTQFKAVKTVGALVVSAADTDIIHGFLQEDAGATATNVPVVVFGETKAVASGIITKGARICPDAAGKVKVAAAADLACGRALSASGADGDVIDIFFIPQVFPVLA